jgi:hypothetical protein
MLEGSGDAVPLHDVTRAISKGVHEAQLIVQSIAQLQLEMGHVKRLFDTPSFLPEELVEALKRYRSVLYNCCYECWAFFCV